MLNILGRCHEEIGAFPADVREDAADALARLQEGQRLSMPLSRPMPAVGLGCHELRLRHRSGSYRVIYRLAGDGVIDVVHAFRKKTRETPWRAIVTAKRRLRGGGA